MFFGPFRYDQVTAELAVGGEMFKAKGRTITDEGWKKVYSTDEEEVDTDTLPAFKKGEEVKIRAIVDDGRKNEATCTFQ